MPNHSFVQNEQQQQQKTKDKNNTVYIFTFKSLFVHPETDSNFICHLMLAS